MSNDKMREEFEAAIALETGRPVQEFRDDRQGESYASVGPKYAWWGWKASREELVIELPLITGFYNISTPIKKIYREAIEAAGLKVKS